MFEKLKKFIRTVSPNIDAFDGAANTIEHSEIVPPIPEQRAIELMGDKFPVKNPNNVEHKHNILEGRNNHLMKEMLSAIKKGKWPEAVESLYWLSMRHGGEQELGGVPDSLHYAMIAYNKDVDTEKLNQPKFTQQQIDEVHQIAFRQVAYTDEEAAENKAIAIDTFHHRHPEKGPGLEQNASTSQATVNLDTLG